MNRETPPKQTSVDFLADTRLFAHLDDKARADAARLLTRRQYKPKAYIFHQGDDGDKLYLIQSGHVRIFINGMDGSETSVILCGKPGEMFGELAVIDGLSRSASAVAVNNAVIHTLSGDNFRRLIQTYPQIGLNFMQILSSKVRYNTKQVDSLASMDIAQRLARQLLDLGQNYGTAVSNGVRINIPLTQSALASLVMGTRESVNKALRMFSRNGLIEMENGRIIILNRNALRQQAAAL